MKIIAGLKLNDETSHIQKLQLCIALARGVLDLKPGEHSVNVFLGTSQRFRTKSTIRGRFEQLEMRATHAARESIFASASPLFPVKCKSVFSAQKGLKHDASATRWLRRACYGIRALQPRRSTTHQRRPGKHPSGHELAGTTVRRLLNDQELTVRKLFGNGAPGAI